MGALGWSFAPPIRGEDGEYIPTKGEVAEMGSDGIEGVTGDSLYGSKFVRELYFRAQKDYEGRYVTPSSLRHVYEGGKVVLRESSFGC